jgi:DNA-binding IclR family transcriptional regulator
VRTLIRRHVRSVGELELLMLLHAERDRSWSVEEICEALACPRSWAIAQLEAMASGGLLEPADGNWRFAPASPELGRATAALVCEPLVSRMTTSRNSFVATGLGSATRR